MTQTDPADRAADRCPGFVTRLVLRCARGDSSALAPLMELLYAPVLARLTPDPASTVSDEVVVRAFVRIWEQAPSYDPTSDGGAVAWLLDQASAAVGRGQPELVAS